MMAGHPKVDTVDLLIESGIRISQAKLLPDSGFSPTATVGEKTQPLFLPYFEVAHS